MRCCCPTGSFNIITMCLVSFQLKRKLGKRFALVSMPQRHLRPHCYCTSGKSVI
jgi:hypothetical protein